MGASIFLITKVDFDRMENRDPEVRRIVGYLHTHEAVERWIADAMATRDAYKGWDGNVYPKFEVEEVRELLVA